MKKTTRFLVILIILPVILWLSMTGIDIVHAQTTQPTPQKVIATIQITNGECTDSPIDIRLEVWNIGSAGGSQYSTATMTATGYDCINGKSGSELKTNHYAGTFSGGPDGNGSVTLQTGPNDAINQTPVPMPFQFIGGKFVKFKSGLELNVENPEAFNAVAVPTQETLSTPGKSCTPSVGNLSGLKPGDTLSPSVDFVDANGKSVAPLSAVWYINGQQTSSITWDGNETKLELQYTCPDNSAHTQNYTVAAYVIQQTPSEQVTTNNNPLPANQSPAATTPTNLPPIALPVVVGTAVVGVIGVLVTGASLVSTLLGGPKPVVLPPSSPPLPPAPPAPQAPTPQAPVQQAPPTEAPSPQVQAAQADAQPAPHQPLSTEERTKLEDISSQMQGEIDRMTTDLNNLKAERQALLNHYKKNTLKFIMKKGLDTGRTIATSAEEEAIQTVLDPVLDKALGMHNTSDDANIILRIHRALKANDEKSRELRREVIHLKDEIQQNNLKLSGT